MIRRLPTWRDVTQSSRKAQLIYHSTLKRRQRIAKGIDGRPRAHRSGAAQAEGDAPEPDVRREA